MSSLWQNLLLSGPMLGFVSAVFQRMLEVSSPHKKDELTHHVIREARIWHGHLLDHYYITPTQFFIEECLAIPAACWMIFVVIGLVGFGIRTDARQRRRAR